MLPLYHDPPTHASLEEARGVLTTTNFEMDELALKIDAAEATLAQVIRDSQCQINKMRSERAELEEKAMLTKAFLSPMRRLPAELLRQIFLYSWDDHPCCAWVLAAVCRSWRTIALRVPIIWSKIRLVTTQNTSADTIRLWLERSGDTIPLDIEIYLRITGSDEPRGRSRLEDSPPPSPVPWGYPPPLSTGSHYMIPPSPLSVPVMPPPPSAMMTAHSPASQNPWIQSPSPVFGGDSNKRASLTTSSTRSVNSWGHIAIYYLVEQMHRWKRFVFRFDRQFNSVNALMSITGDAPLLEEFEVSSAEAGFYTEWRWLPSAQKSETPSLPNLRTLRLQYTPFKWSSPMLHSNLRTLSLRALPSINLPVDRLMHILSSNPELEDISLNFSAASSAVLPLSTTTLSHCKKFHIGGHHALSSLVDNLALPVLEDLGIDIDTRDIEGVITDLLSRSESPPLEHLSVAYAEERQQVSPMYYGGSVIVSWQALLRELSHLKTLRVGSTSLESIMTALDRPMDHLTYPPHGNPTSDTWLAPKLEELAIRNCTSPTVDTDGVSRIVQMVEARNPGKNAAGPVVMNGVSPVRLQKLELWHCASLGEDVVDWLKERVEEVEWSEPEFGGR